VIQRYIAFILLLVVAVYLAGCSGISQKRKSSEQVPDKILEEDIGDSKKSHRGSEIEQETPTDSSRSAHRNNSDNSTLDTQSQSVPEESDSANLEPAQQAPRRFIWKGNKGQGRSWAPGDEESQ
jgi:hypothetical protein